MAWTTFKLGRPGSEAAFDVNPEDFSPVFERVSSDQYNLAGDLKERVLRTMRPSVKIKSSWFPKSQLDLLLSLIPITDTFLAFTTRDDWKISLEPNLATASTVQIQNSSITKLSAIYAAGGWGGSPTNGSITVTGVFDNPNGTGTNYWTGGSYADATRTITLGTGLPGPLQVYVTYTFTGWLVRLKAISAPISGGRVDLFTYDFQLDGV